MKSKIVKSNISAFIARNDFIDFFRFFFIETLLETIVLETDK